MCFGTGAVDADGHATHARLLDAGESLGGHQASSRGGERGTHSLLHSVGENVKEVAAHHGIAAGDHQDGVAELLDLIDEADSLTVGQLVRVSSRLGLRAAVLAGECAGSSQLPGDGEGGEVEVGLGQAGVMGLPLDQGLWQLLRHATAPDRCTGTGQRAASSAAALSGAMPISSSVR